MPFKEPKMVCGATISQRNANCKNCPHKEPHHKISGCLNGRLPGRCGYDCVPYESAYDIMRNRIKYEDLKNQILKEGD